MPETLEQQLARLKAVKRSGVLETSYEGKRVIYRSMDDINNAITDLEREIQAASGTRRPGVGFVSFSRY